MIKESIVSFEQAKLLKEKGFPQDYDKDRAYVYNEEDYEDEYEVQRMVLETRHIKAGTLSSYPCGVDSPKCYASTLSLVQKWLREEKNIDISINVYDGDNKISVKEYEWHIYSICDSICVYNSYELALSEAINKALELI